MDPTVVFCCSSHFPEPAAAQRGTRIRACRPNESRKRRSEGVFIAQILQLPHDLLEPVGLPKDYHIGIVPASDTGAVEMAMWSLLGPKPITCVHFESFGGDWFTDITKQLKLKDVTNMQGDYGQLPDFSKIDFNQVRVRVGV